MVENKIKEGEKFFQAGLMKEAEASFLAVLALDPANIRALNNLSVMAISQKLFHKAEAYITEALKHSQDDHLILNTIMVLKQIEGQWGEAEAAAKNLLRSDGRNIKALKAILRCHLKTKTGPESEIYAEELLKAAPADPEAFSLGALVCEKNGRADQAAEILEAGLKIVPDSEMLALQLVNLKDPQLLVASKINPLASTGEKTAELLNKIWGGIKTEAPALKAAKTLGNFYDPGRLTDDHLPLSPSRPPLDYAPPTVYHNDLKGLKIMFAPTSIAGVNPLMKLWLEKQGVMADVVEVSRNYLNYKADYYYPDEIAKLPDFIDKMMDKAKQKHFLCLDFGSSLSYFPNFVSRIKYNDKNEGSPYDDLLGLKEAGVKIIFQFFGSDCCNQSVEPYVYLKYLGFNDLPQPPAQTKYQYLNIKAAEKIADVFVAPPYFTDWLPKVCAPYWDMPIDPDLWPMKKQYNSKVEKILTAPTNPRKKNYALALASLNSLLARHQQISSFRVSGMAHDKVVGEFAKADLGIDQVARSFGLFSIEMMALGLPVITNRIPGSAYRDAAPTLTFQNIRDFYARLEECVKNPDMLPELGRQGRQYALTYHDIATIGRNYGQILSDTLAGKPGQVYSESYERDSLIWTKDPEKVYAFKFYDVAVPLFCALGEFEYALYLCLDALDCDYRDEKFMAWHQAISRASGLSAPLYKTPPESDSYKKQIISYQKILKSLPELLREYENMMKEAEVLRY